MGCSKSWGAVLILLVSVLAVGLAQGFLSNHSFEVGTDPGEVVVLAPGSKDIDGWSVVGGNVLYVGTRWKAAHGLRSIGLPCGAGIVQTLNTDPGGSYEVRFSMAGDPNVRPAVKSVTLSFGDTRRVFTFDTTGRSVGDMGWDSRSWIFTAAAETTTVTFQSPAAECSTVAVDNVRVTPGESAVQTHPLPEPGVRAGSRSGVFRGNAD
jgi:choice-of-anchor C domain-containing protein